MTTRNRLAVAVGALLAGSGLAEERGAASEGEWQAAAGAAFATTRADGRWPVGGGVSLEGRYGLSDLFSARAEIGGSWHPTSADPRRPGGTARVAGLTAGLACALDVFRVVPFAELGLAAQHLGGAVVDGRSDLGLEAGAGAEYLLDRRWAVALAFRLRFLPVRLGGEDDSFGGTPATFRAVLRLGRSF